jgi:hypothetical protein
MTGVGSACQQKLALRINVEHRVAEVQYVDKIIDKIDYPTGSTPQGLGDNRVVLG